MSEDLSHLSNRKDSHAFFPHTQASDVHRSLDTAVTRPIRHNSKLNAQDSLSKALKQLHPDSRKPFREIIERIKYAKREYEDIRQSSEEAVRASIQIYSGKRSEAKLNLLKFDSLSSLNSRLKSNKVTFERTRQKLELADPISVNEQSADRSPDLTNIIVEKLAPKHSYGFANAMTNVTRSHVFRVK